MHWRKLTKRLVYSLLGFQIRSNAEHHKNEHARRFTKPRRTTHRSSFHSSMVGGRGREELEQYLRRAFSHEDGACAHDPRATQCHARDAETQKRSKRQWTWCKQAGKQAGGGRGQVVQMLCELTFEAPLFFLSASQAKPKPKALLDSPRRCGLSPFRAAYGDEALLEQASL